MFGQFRSKKNPCNMRFMHYHSMHYDNFYCIALGRRVTVGRRKALVPGPGGPSPHDNADNILFIGVLCPLSISPLFVVQY